MRIKFLTALAVLGPSVCCALAQGTTAFTYQGRLDANGTPASGIYDLRFAIYDSAVGGSQVGPIFTSENVAISNGLFTTAIDFGAAAFDGSAGWLEIAVQPADSTSAFTVLDPRQALTPTPYAITASNLSGMLPDARLSANVALRNAANVFTRGPQTVSPALPDTGLIVRRGSPSQTANLQEWQNEDGTRLASVSTFGIFAGNGFTGNGSGLTGLDASQLASGLVPDARLPATISRLGPSIESTEIADGTITSADVDTTSFNTVFWRTGGNPGTTPSANFLGTTDNQPLELRVNNQRAFRLTPGTFGPNVIGGSSQNSVAAGVSAATIGGGRLHVIGTNANYATIAGGLQNKIFYDADTATIGGGQDNMIETNASRATIAGGYGNTIETNASESTIAGGYSNRIQTHARRSAIGGGASNGIQTNAFESTITGGFFNQIQTNAHRSAIGGGGLNTIETGASRSVIAGGQLNTVRANAGASAIGGGERNTNAASYATVPGGRDNIAAGQYSLAAGRRAKASHLGAFVWADSTDADFSSGAVNQFAVRASGGVRLETAGAGATLDGQPILKGSVSASQIADGATLAELSDDDGPGSGLDADLLDGREASSFWQLGGNAGVIPGTHFLGTTDSQPLEIKVNGQRALRLEPTADGPNIVGGWQANAIAPGVVSATISGGGGATVPNAVVAESGTIGGGTSNLVAGRSSTVGGGFFNRIESGSEVGTIAGGAGNLIEFSTRWTTIGGGGGNVVQANSDAATIAGGLLNNIEGDAASATISGGGLNVIRDSSNGATIGGGSRNQIEGLCASATISGGTVNKIDIKSSAATISGGQDNAIGSRSFAAMIPGGESNVVNGSWSLAAGRRAKANHDGTFVWADSTDADFASTTDKQFAVRANNGVLIQAANTALDLRGGGALRVQGAGLGRSTPVFIHRATAANINANITVIDHPHCNGDPNAILIVTPNWNPGGAGGTYNSHPVGVYYNGTRWTIFNQDIAAMPVNAAFNVLVFKP